MPRRLEAHERNRELALKHIKNGQPVLIPQPNLPKHYIATTKLPEGAKVAQRGSNKRRSSPNQPAGIVVERVDRGEGGGGHGMSPAEREIQLEFQLDPLANELAELREEVKETPAAPKAAKTRKKAPEEGKE